MLVKVDATENRRFNLMAPCKPSAAQLSLDDRHPSVVSKDANIGNSCNAVIALELRRPNGAPLIEKEGKYERST